MKAPILEGIFKTGNKLFPILSVFFVLLILMGVFAAFYVMVQSSADKKFLAFASEQKQLTQRIEAYAYRATSGDEKAFSQLRVLRDRFEELLSDLASRKNKVVLSKLSEDSQKDLTKIDQYWQQYRVNIDVILNAKEQIILISDAANKIQELIPSLLGLSNEMLQILAKTKTNNEHIKITIQQLLLIQRLSTFLSPELNDIEKRYKNAEKLGQDLQQFGNTLEGLMQGDSKHDIQIIQNPQARQKLKEIEVLYSKVEEDVDVIVGLSSQLSELGQALSQVTAIGAEMLNEESKLQTHIEENRARLDGITVVPFILFGLAIALLLVLGYLMSRNARERLEMTNETNRRNQRAILRLLDEMTNLGEGDLTVRATVTEDITGAIADSVNYSIDALRSLVTTINQTAVKLSSAAETTQGTARRFADASSHQAKQIAVATAAIAEMAESIKQVSKNSTSSAKVAQTSVQIAHKGAKAVSRTIDGMGTIREQIQETSKRIKRLGESSQEIGDIVSLINEIADQTNILALNAAIQASTAGEAGRGFAVVADEVQRLAERAGNATKQIETLVKTIQSDTNEAVTSMEQSTSNVVAGAKLAENAGEALTEIESVSNRIAVLIKSISQAAQQQSSAAANITNTMNVIQEITMQTSEGTAETANSVANLTGLASELRRSVSGFKLPSSEAGKAN